MHAATIALVLVLSACAAAKAEDAAHNDSGSLFTAIANAVKPPEQAKAPEAPKARSEQPKRVELPKGRVCFNAAETREKISAHHLAEPFRALRASRLQGEALKVRLCRWKQDDYVYEVAVLRRDGRVVHLYMNASNGQSLGSIGDGDRK